MTSNVIAHVQFALPYVLDGAYDAAQDGDTYQLLHHIPRRLCRETCSGTEARYTEPDMEYLYLNVPIDESEQFLSLEQFIQKHQDVFDKHVPLARLTRVTGWDHFLEEDAFYSANGDGLTLPMATVMAWCDRVTLFLELESLAVFARYHS